MSKIFYVYEHWRPDTNICFYVGKGCRQRAYVFNRRRERSYLHVAVVEQLKVIGLQPEIRFIAKDLDESEAFTLEIERIKLWRYRGIKLANITDGGDGVSGRKLSPEAIERLKNRTFTESHRRKISASKIGQPKSAEHRRKLSEANLGKIQSEATIQKRIAPLIGRPRLAETRTKISVSKKGKTGVRGRIPWCKGKQLSVETRKKMSEAHRGKKRGPMSVVQKEKIRYSLLGRSNLALKGKPLSPSHRQKLIEAWAIRKARNGATDSDVQVGGGVAQEVSQSAGSIEGARLG